MTNKGMYCISNQYRRQAYPAQNGMDDAPTTDTEMRRFLNDMRKKYVLGTAFHDSEKRHYSASDVPRESDTNLSNNAHLNSSKNEPSLDLLVNPINPEPSHSAGIAASRKDQQYHAELWAELEGIKVVVKELQHRNMMLTKGKACPCMCQARKLSLYISRSFSGRYRYSKHVLLPPMHVLHEVR